MTALMPDPGPEGADRLARALERASEVLPAQGPITVFVHHNTLHSFENLEFEKAVVAGGELLGCEPFLSEERYRHEYRRGRIRELDLRAVLRRDLGATAAATVGGLAGRLELRLGWLEHGIPAASGQVLDWLLGETSVLEVARCDLSATSRQRLLGPRSTRASERNALQALWEACRTVVSRAAPPTGKTRRPPIRHRDLLIATLGEDPDTLVHPLLIRLCAGYLDQGIASWSMPDRQQGFYRCVTRLYGLGLGSPAPWMRVARRLLAEEAAAGRSALESIERSLAQLGVMPDEWEEYLTTAALALRGWAGMMQQVEQRPDRMPVHAPPATLRDFLAIRLLLDRAAAEQIVREELGTPTVLSQVRAALVDRLPRTGPPPVSERAWPLFHLAQILGVNAEAVSALRPEGIGTVLDEIDAFDDLARRRAMHLAFERRLRNQFYDAVASHDAEGRRERRFQAVFCLDEREESIRRHLEEVAPDCETFGTAGFFGVAMYYRGADEMHARPLCPVAVQPEHEVKEVRLEGGDRWGLRARFRRTWGRLGLGMALGSRTVIRGTLGTALLGALAAVPLVFRVISPRLTARLLLGGRTLLGGGDRSRLALGRGESAPSLGRYSGFTPDEMAAIVRRLVEDTGLSPLAPAVLIVGHGSTSLNNPHESAHDCGACGGGRGGPNARAFAQMANDTEVRRRLAGAGLVIPSGTWFVGAEHNTANDAVEYFDLDRVPQDAWPRLREAMDSLAEARLRNAHERCRRFKAAPLWYPKQLCLRHVETRTEDLAQTRPEYGHATNAFCVVGRRERTRGLFLDRRAFLVSYDPSSEDAEAKIIARILAGVVPVVAGISLEYYFAYVDPTGYGCGTKLPHNIAALLGVMDGHTSDLRSGLPRQMIEIHEPVRLSILVETSTETLRVLIQADPSLQRLVANRWIVIAALEPGSSVIHEFESDGFIRHIVETASVPRAGSSADWYQGRRDFLEFCRIGSAAQGGMVR